MVWGRVSPNQLPVNSNGPSRLACELAQAQFLDGAVDVQDLEGAGDGGLQI